MGQSDLLLVLAQIRSVHGAKRPTTDAGSNTVSTWGKETYYWCWLKYGKYMGQRDLLLVLAQIREVHGAKRPATGAGSNTVSTWGKVTYYWCWLKYGE